MTKKQKSLMGFAGGVIAATLASPAAAGLVYDVRLSSGGGKSVNTTVGGSFSIDVFAVITGVNGTATDDGFTNGFFSLLSNNALSGPTLKMDVLSGGGPIAPFNSGSTSGQLQDMEASPDGDIDAGKKTGQSGNTAFIFPRTGTAGGELGTGTGSAELKLATYTISVTAGGAAGSINVVLPGLSNTGTVTLTTPINYKQDGVQVTTMTNVSVGSAVTVNVAASSFLSVTGSGVGTDRGDVVVEGSGNSYDIEVLDLAGDPTSGFVDIFNNNLSTPWSASPTIVLLDTNGQALPGGTNLNGGTLLSPSEFAALNGAAGGGFDFGYSFGAGSKFSFDLGTVALDRIAVVPEPTTFGLLGLGALGLTAMRRRRMGN